MISGSLTTCPKRLGAKSINPPHGCIFLGKEFYIAHGDEFYKNDRGFRIIRSIFHGARIVPGYMLPFTRAGQ